VLLHQAGKSEGWSSANFRQSLCSDCTADLEVMTFSAMLAFSESVGVPYRQCPAANSRRPVFTSVLVCLLAVAGVIYWRTYSVATPAQVADSIPVAVTIDLSHADTTRSTDTTTVPVGVLPRSVVTAHVMLPNFSPGGNYVVSVTTDRGGASGNATVSAAASVQGFHADLTVTLDLRSLPPGTCFLATTHDGDPASDFYPLTVR
jgi:hypothetical protein